MARKSFAPHFSRVLLIPLAVLFGGCATFINGTHQDFEIRSTRPGVKVKLDRERALELPVTLSLPRSEDRQSLRFITPGDTGAAPDTVRIYTERRFSHATWTNFLIGLWGLPGALVDLGWGGGWYIVPDPRGRAPSHIRMIEDPDPWKSGEWRGSVSTVVGAKQFPEDETHTGNFVNPEFAFQFAIARKDWPVELETRWYVISSLAPTAFVIAEAGARKTFLTDHDYRPWFAGGLALLNRSTQEHGGFPVGVWARGGMDLRPAGKFVISPYLGFSKFELASAQGARNTAGLTGGISFGRLF